MEQRMANNTPFGNNGLSANLLPGFYQTTPNKKFLQATIDQLYQPGNVTKINGYIGKENSKATVVSDTFVAAANTARKNYQLEPGIVIKDNLGNIEFFKDYIDYINQINVFGGNTNNHARLNDQEFYSWNPNINWDKLTNFQNYYWLPYGPETIKITGQQLKVTSTYQVDLISVGSDNQYIFTPNGLTPNPVIKLYRGQTYTFVINSLGNPFSFKLQRTAGNLNRYITSSIDAYGVEQGTITFHVPTDAPSLIYYQSETDFNLGGIVEIYDIDENTYIDIETDILGKQVYTLTNGTVLSNGMKVTFEGNVTPAMYATGQYYVEGVGTAIKLVPESVLQVVTPYTIAESIKFDATPFDKDPFSDATGYASLADYIVINRASRDRNPWSRYNRWFHKDVIVASSTHNGVPVELDQSSRAVRPIIEFNADLKLFNFGTTSTIDVDVIDDFTLDVFSTIEGSLGYNIDGIKLSQGQTLLVTSDTDPLVNNKIYRVEFIDVTHANGIRNDQIHLVEVASPFTNQTLLIKEGLTNQSSMYWFNGTKWIKGPIKSNTNQPPVFDIVNESGVSYSELTGSTFKGTKLFSYKIGSTGTIDPILGFKLSYKNVGNIGDIVFNFDLISDTFEFKNNSNLVTQSINTGYLVSQDYTGNAKYLNGWEISKATTSQAAVRIYKDKDKFNNFDVDIFNDIEQLDDLIIRVYVGGALLSKDDWILSNGPVYKFISLKNPITSQDILTIKAYASQPINGNGFYEIPLNLQNNPMNDVIGDFTLGEVIDHTASIVANLTNFKGSFPGASNLRDLGNITQYGTKFVQHSGPASLALYHVTSESNNIVRAIEQSRDDYANFKKIFVSTSENLGIDSDPVSMVDLILQKINKDKPNTGPYYFSDMVGYGASLKTEINVVDYRIKTYPLTSVFSLDSLSSKSCLVYINGSQLLYGKDYTFNSQGFILMTDSLEFANDDIITIYEYESTDGCFIPETPTKLGIWPKYEPKIYLDTSLLTARVMIQGHDGSQTLAYGDYRDTLILELEKRIFNNIKVQYDTSIFDINDTIPSYNRKTPYTNTEFNSVLAPHFYKWAKTVNNDFSQSLSFDNTNTFSYNYSRNSSPDGTSLPGYWRGVYRWLLDTDRPHVCPWEMLGFTLEPSWWIETYGPAPYTNDNRVMWQDITDGIIRQPNTPVATVSKYAKPFLMSRIPVDSAGNLTSPVVSGLASGTITSNSNLNFVFGDVGPVEGSWRRSSYYPFSVLITGILLNPSKLFGLLIDRSRILRNKTGQLIYKDTNLRIRPQDVVLPSVYSSSARVQTAGIINYLVNHILNYVFSNNLKSYSKYAYDLSEMTSQLSYRLGSFTNKDRFNLLLDSKTPSSTGSVFIPKENYSVFLNTSNPIKKLLYSGVMITRLKNVYQISGYSQSEPYFKCYEHAQSGATINVGGITESYVNWSAGESYAISTVVKHVNKFFRTTVTHTSTAEFNSQNFDVLQSIPIQGGRSAVFRKSWNKSNIITVPYGTGFDTVQSVVDFLVGYGEWLKDQGFVFNDFNSNLGQVSNWETSAKEFLFWTTQNWSSGQDKWNDWAPGEKLEYGNIVRYNGEYYSATATSQDLIFDSNKFTKLSSLNISGASVISLSPVAGNITFTAALSVVDDIKNPFNNYEIVKVDGTSLLPPDLESYRNNNTVSYKPRTNDGIYGASFYLIQHEHVVIIDNNTIFNDTIFNPASGYRQERIKVAGYVTNNWHGGLDIPGFIFDSATITEWQPWQDYNLGDIINYQGFYYSANKFLPGVSDFVTTDWTLLDKKPVPKILPNWTNIATQFTDFYNLDTDSFDYNQQTVAHHLIGYQKRQYLSNIIQDDVSEFKFYQGMIREKGTANVLNKLFDVLQSEDKESIEFYEEWAIRVGQYGANSAFDQIEFVIDELKVKSNPQGFILTNQVDSTLNSFVIQLTPNDVYLKPSDYNSTPWPETSSYTPLLRSAGYVNSGDVTISLGNISEILNYDPTTLTNGSYIWSSFDVSDWNVYRFSDLGLNITGVSYDTGSKILTVTTENLLTLSVGNYIGITQTTNINGFYKIVSITLNSFAVSAPKVTTFSPFNNLPTITIYALLTQRTSSIDNLDSVLPLKLKGGELLWTDTDANTKWCVWEYNTVYTETDIINANPLVNSKYGRAIAVSKIGNILASSSSTGQLQLYTKTGILEPWTNHQLLQKPVASSNLTGSSSGTIVNIDLGSLLSSTTMSGATPGSGYTPLVGSQIYTSVPLTGGTGSGAIANITITNGSVTAVDLLRYTDNYVSGELLSASATLLGGTVIVPFQTRITNSCGSGYTPAVGTVTYRNVSLTSGTGVGATADIQVRNGEISFVQIVDGGTNYSSGNILSATASSIGGTVSVPFNVTVSTINLNQDTTLASVIAFSNDNTWMATGSPLVGYVSTNHIGPYSSGVNYPAKSIVSSAGKVYQSALSIQSTYTSIGGTTLNQGQGARFNVVVIGSSYTVNTVSGGAGYKNGNRIKILGSAVGGIDTVNDIIITVTGVLESSITSVTATGTCPPRTYITLPGDVVLGIDAKFNITTNLTGYTATVSNIGSGYVLGDRILISGSSVGGVDILNDITIIVQTLGLSSMTVSVTGISGWVVIPYVPVDLGGTNSSLIKQGIITLYKKDATNNYFLVDSIISPIPSNNEQFGSTLTFGNNILYVGAIGSNNTGKVYRLIYSSLINTSSAYNPVGSSNSIVVVTSTTGIKTGMTVQGVGFISGQYVLSVTSDTTLLLSGSPDSTPSGILNFVTTSWSYDFSETALQSIPNGATQYGTSIQLSLDTKTLVISALGSVYIYKTVSNLLSLTQTLTGSTSRFGSSVAISDDGTYIAISDDIESTAIVNQEGSVKVYKLNSSTYALYQTLVNRIPEVSQKFGNKLFFMNDYETLVVYSQEGDTRLITTFDNLETTFDKDSTTFVSPHINSGRVDVYDRYLTKWVFSETLPTTSVNNDGYGVGLAVGENQIFVGAPFTVVNSLSLGKVYNYNKLPDNYTWKKYAGQSSVPDIKKIKKAFLYNKSLGTLLTYLDVIDPLQGKIAGPAEEEIKYKTFYDPATYSVGTNAVTVDPSNIWSSNQIGTLWWDLRTAKFINSYDSSITYRTNTWSKLAQGASIDVYEWVSTNLKPSQWNSQSDTDGGLASGISGSTLYGDTTYSLTQTYDKISKTFKNKYYYWVKNTVVIPKVSNRFISAKDVSSLISNPQGQAYTYLALTGLDSFSLVNAQSYLTGSDVVLSVEYWNIDKTDQNIHSQYKIISNDPKTSIPTTIEQKWIDSLCGVDTEGRLVPNPVLPIKLQYGIENRPRQGMFVNRLEALKQLIEYANQILIKNQIVKNNNISSLELFDPEPSVLSGLYDKILDTDAELSYANVSNFAVPVLIPVIVDGKIVDITIKSAGKGYIKTITNIDTAPFITINGAGIGAVAQAEINSLGQIIGAVIISGGEGYDSNTTCSIRNYSVLVHSDTQAEGTWSIYSYDPIFKLWSRTLTQRFDVRNYWSYVNWFATGYNQFTLVDFAIDTFADLNTIETSIGDNVKIRSANSGGWLILEKYSNTTSIDWTQSYQVVGVENGTIQFDSSLYQFANTLVGFDSGIYDDNVYDVVASVELRNILIALKDVIFIGDLKQEYLNLFFNSIHYVLSEQVYVDWIFKTSFVKAQHNVGDLDQPVNYPVDNLANFEDYINEVKPYRTKIREYISNYDGTDVAQLPITDFDLMPIYENSSIGLINATIKDGKIFSDNAKIREYPWKFWLDNASFDIVDLVLNSGGTGYIIAPDVKIISDSGTGAVARAFINNGKVNRVVLLEPGTGYLSAPTVILDGGLSENGTQGSVSAIIGNSVIRSTKVTIKFDRHTSKQYITQLKQVETFLGTGSNLQFSLKWAPNATIGNSSVTLNGIPVLRELYTLSTVTSVYKGYESFSGLLTLDISLRPIVGNVVVTYLINEASLNSADRIEFYYAPQEGQLGKDLSQLMTGIDYGGVIVDGLGFNITTGWSSQPYYTDKWDSVDSKFDDYFVTVSAGTRTFPPVNGVPFPSSWSTGTQVNIYHVKNNIDSYVSNGIQKEFVYNPLDNNPVVTTVATIQTVGLSKTFVEAGSYDTTLKLSDTTGIVEGMGIIGIGFASNVAALVTTGITGNGSVVTVTYDTQTTPPYNVGQTIIISNVLPTAYNGSHTVTECTTTYVKFIATTTGSQTRPGTVRGSSVHTVASIVDSTTVRLSRAPDSIPNGQLIFTFGFSGSTYLSVANSANIHIGDVVACSTVKALLYSATVTEIVNSTTVKLNSLVYANLLPAVNLTFTRTLIEPNDVTINANGTFVLVNPIPVDVIINVTGTINPVRLDDPYYGILSGAHIQTNDSAVITTPVYNGTTGFSITLPNTFTVVDGDRFIFRKSTSDGSVTPAEADYDTSLIGGNLSYTTAVGIAADDILVDGDGFITPTSSPAPEEVVPGQLVDAVAIKVYDRPNSGSATMKVDNFVATGAQRTFVMTQQPNSNKAVIVKVGNFIKTLGTDYSIDYKNKSITFVTPPTVNQIVSIFNIGFNGSNLLDLDYFIGDGSTVEFITKAPWLSAITTLIYIDGIPTTPELFQTDNSYDFVNAVGLRFIDPPIAGSLINFIVVSGTQQTFAITNTERVATDGVNKTYKLSSAVGVTYPLESSMLVRVNQTILKGPNDNYFTIEKNRFSYTLDPAKVLPNSVELDDVNVLANGVKLSLGKDYTVDLSGITIKITKAAYSKYKNTSLIVSITSNEGYFYNPATQEITFNLVYSTNDIVEVVSSYNHAILDMQRTEINITSNISLTPDTLEFYYYSEIKSGLIHLDRSVIDDNYLWIIKDNTLLVPSIDFKVNDDRKSIQLAVSPTTNQAITVITFSSNVLSSGIAYQQFKDMLNRTHFKRLSLNKRTKLTRPLLWKDTIIAVEDATNFDTPNSLKNLPGVVEINGERIEYFAKSGNILSRLRRGTLGTGVKNLYAADTAVQDIGPTETVPYTENSIVEQRISDGTHIVNLGFTPTKSEEVWTYRSGFTSSIPTGYGQSDDIEVFIGGYNDGAIWAPNVVYPVGVIVNVGSYTYRCVVGHTSGSNFNDDVNKWEFFVGNIRLKKKPYKMHNVNNAPRSPAGDVQLDAEFAVDGLTNQLRLTHLLSTGTQVTVVKRTGIAWDSIVNIQNDTSKISEFLKSSPGVWYTDYKN